MDAFHSIPTEFWLVIFFLFGALLGSFANVVIYRLPEGKSVVRPRSRCPACLKQIAWYDNIPVLSWFILQGRCRMCGARFSFRYPVVEFLTAVLFAGAFYVHGFSATFVESVILLWSLVVCTFIDFDHMILPDEFTLSGIVIGLIGAYLNPDRGFLDAVLGVLAGGGFLWFMAWVYFTLTEAEGMGGGDIKLLAWLGAVLGLKAVPFIIIISAVVGTIFGLVIGLRKDSGLKTAIPYGPYLAFAAMVYIFWGQTLARTYWDFFLPS